LSGPLWEPAGARGIHALPLRLIPQRNLRCGKFRPRRVSGLLLLGELLAHTRRQCRTVNHAGHMGDLWGCDGSLRPQWGDYWGGAGGVLRGRHRRGRGGLLRCLAAPAVLAGAATVYRLKAHRSQGFHGRKPVGCVEPCGASVHLQVLPSQVERSAIAGAYTLAMTSAYDQAGNGHLARLSLASESTQRGVCAASAVLGELPVRGESRRHQPLKVLDVQRGALLVVRKGDMREAMTVCVGVKVVGACCLIFIASVSSAAGPPVGGAGECARGCLPVSSWRQQTDARWWCARMYAAEWPRGRGGDPMDHLRWITRWRG